MGRVHGGSTGQRDTYPWIALNLGGIQQQTHQFVDVSRVEVTIGKNTEAEFAVYVSKLSPDNDLFECLREETGTCNERTNIVISTGSGTGSVGPTVTSTFLPIERWLGPRNPKTIRLGKRKGSFDDEDTFSISPGGRGSRRGNFVIVRVLTDKKSLNLREVKVFGPDLAPSCLASPCQSGPIDQSGSQQQPIQISLNAPTSSSDLAA